MFNIETLRSKSVTELTKILKDLGVKVARNSTENDKIFAILDFQASNPKVAKEYFGATESIIDTEEKAAEKPAKAPARKAAPKKTAAKPKTEAKAEQTPKAEEKIETEEKPSPEPIQEEVKAEPTETAEDISAPAAKKKRKRVSTTNATVTETVQEKPELHKNTESPEPAPAEERPKSTRIRSNRRRPANVAMIPALNNRLAKNAMRISCQTVFVSIWPCSPRLAEVKVMASISIRPLIKATP